MSKASSEIDRDNDVRPALPPRPLRALGNDDWSSVQDNVDLPLLELSSPSHPSRPAPSARDVKDSPLKDIKATSPQQQDYDVSRGGDSRYRLRKKNEIPLEGHLPPQVFHKTRTFIKWDFGYWREPARHMAVFCAVFPLLYVPSHYASIFAVELSSVNKLGPFEYDCAKTEGWTFVGVNLAYGEFSFGQAKAIDLAWNWVVGRGYQGILSIIAYRIFTDALLRATEMTALPLELYATLALPSAKLVTLYQLGKNLFRFGNWRIKFMFVWLFLSTIYLIAIPGLLDAATAYEASVSTSFKFDNKTVENVENLRPMGNNVATPVKTCLTFQNANKVQTWQPNLQDYGPFSHIEWTPQFCADTGRNGKFVESTGMWQYNMSRFNLYNWQDSAINKSYYHQLEKDPISVFDTRKWAEWKFAPVERANFICDMDSSHYQWGFSKEWLFLVTMLNNVFIIGCWILWIDCDTNSQLCRARRRIGIWTAIADLSEVMQAELGNNLCAYSDGDILRAIQERPPVKYTSTPSMDGERIHVGLSSGVPSKKRFKIIWGKEYGRLKED